MSKLSGKINEEFFAIAPPTIFFIAPGQVGVARVLMLKGGCNSGRHTDTGGGRRSHPGKGLRTVRTPSANPDVAERAALSRY
jgi:hypothetical protein